MQLGCYAVARYDMLRTFLAANGAIVNAKSVKNCYCCCLMLCHAENVLVLVKTCNKPDKGLKYINERKVNIKHLLLPESIPVNQFSCLFYEIFSRNRPTQCADIGKRRPGSRGSI